jgi:hypothetical protein
VERLGWTRPGISARPSREQARGLDSNWALALSG